MNAARESLEPSLDELNRIRHPHLVHGLFAAACNGLRYVADTVTYQLSPEQYTSPPIKRPNFELGEWLGRFRDV